MSAPPSRVRFLLVAGPPLLSLTVPTLYPGPERIVEFVRGLADFRIYATIDGDYDHIGATVADAILQANRNYVSFVAPRVKRIREQFPTQRTTRAVLDVLRGISTTEFLGLLDATRAARVDAALALFAREGVDTETDLREWLLLHDGVAKLRTIEGIGPKTADYFKILVGIPECAMDRHLLGFLAMAGIPAAGYEESQATINTAADLLAVNRAHFDHSIWRYMSRRAAGKRAGRARGRQRAGTCDGDLR